MRRFKAWVSAHVVLSCVFVTLLFAGAAVAAFVVYQSTYSGTINGSFGSAGNGGPAVSVSQNTGTPTAVMPCTSGSGATCTGGTEGNISVELTNNTPNAETIASFSASFATTGHSECDGHLFPANDFTGLVVPASGKQSVSFEFVADPSTPASCSAAPVVVTLSGTTNP